MDSIFIFRIKHFNKFLNLAHCCILRFLLFFYVDNFPYERFMLFDKFLVVLSQSFMLNINKIFQLFDGVLFLSRSIKTLKNLLKTLLRMIETFKSINKFKINIHLFMKFVVNFLCSICKTIDLLLKVTVEVVNERFRVHFKNGVKEISKILNEFM